MIITVDKLNIDFNTDIDSMKQQIAELRRLEKAIEESAHYALLSGKTQMLAKGNGVTRKERSRMIHTQLIAYVVEVTINNIYNKFLEENPDLNSDEYRQMFQLNREIAIRRGMIMVKAHDIGHVAMGHVGEKAINNFMSQIKDTKDIGAVLDEHKRYFGEEYEKNQGHIIDKTDFDFALIPIIQSLSFEHNELGAILFNQIVEREDIKFSPEEIRKLTLGILGHSTSRTPIDLLEGDLIAQIVRVADKVEYINSDWDEIESLIKIDPDLEFELALYLQKDLDERLNETSRNLAGEALKTGEITENHSTMRRLSRMRKLYDNIIFLYDGTYAEKILADLLRISDDPEALRRYYDTHKGVEALYPSTIIEELKNDRETLKKDPRVYALEIDDAYQRILNQQVHFKSVMQGENSDRIHFIYERILQYYYSHPEKIPEKVTRTIRPIDLKQSKQFSYALNSSYSNLQKVLEYVSLMDDESFMQEYKRLVEERIEKGEGFGVEPVRMDEIKGYLRTKYDEEAQKLVIEENIGTRSYEEARTLLAIRSRKFYYGGLTSEGFDAKDRFYKKRFGEYAEDLEYLQRMLKADEARSLKKGESDSTRPEAINTSNEQSIGSASSSEIKSLENR